MVVLAAALVLGSGVPLALQAENSPQKTAVVVSSPAPDQTQPPARPPATRETPGRKVSRWLDWQVGSVESRYRWIENTAGVVTSNQLQHKQTLRAAFKFDPKGRYTLQTLAGTGGSFVSSWENTGLGMGGPDWAFNVRQFYLQAVPVDGIEASWGGMSLSRGEHTEITTFDNDNYVVAGRVSVKRPAALYFDEIAVTAGYLGDLRTPNVFRRLDRGNDHNYTQVLVAKKLGGRVAVSADWSEIAGVSTLRQAIRVATKDHLPLDFVRFENYQRVDGPEPAWGFTISTERAVHRKLVLAGGYADIDEHNGTLSGDRYFRGKRLFFEPRILILPELTLSFFVAEAVGNEYPVVNEHRFDTVLTFNVLRALQRAGAW